jgi:starch synthase
MRILFATSEVYPLIKTGGLADVSHSLPLALQQAGHDVNIVLPFYRVIKSKLNNLQCEFQGKIFGYTGTISVYKTLLSEKEPVVVWLVDAPDLFDREGGPYTDSYNQGWVDSAYRFAIFSRVVALLGNNQLGLDWQPDIVHCNDWQTGLVIPLLQLETHYPATVFTIHNLSYQGNFTREEFETLRLPLEWWSIKGIEFYGMCSFLKAGVLHADWVTTVSPSYAKEIQTPELGERFDGLLRYRCNRFKGILNGIDYRQWNPETDPFIDVPYSKDDLDLKTESKKSLQKKLGLTVREQIPVFGMVCRLVYQKGVDLLIDILPELLKTPLHIVILGCGDTLYEDQFLQLQMRFPDCLSVTIGYDEGLAHQIEAGSDFFLMPSRYEPCGLNQIYSLRYGTLPIVRNTGGLADTVINATPQTINNHQATGFVFEQAESGALLSAINRAVATYQDKPVLHQLRICAMEKEFTWEKSRQEYEEIYFLAANETSLQAIVSN